MPAGCDLNFIRSTLTRPFSSLTSTLSRQTTPSKLDVFPKFPTLFQFDLNSHLAAFHIGHVPNSRHTIHFTLLAVTNAFDQCGSDNLQICTTGFRCLVALMNSPLPRYIPMGSTFPSADPKYSRSPARNAVPCSLHARIARHHVPALPLLHLHKSEQSNPNVDLPPHRYGSPRHGLPNSTIARRLHPTSTQFSRPANSDAASSPHPPPNRPPLPDPSQNGPSSAIQAGEQPGHLRRPLTVQWRLTCAHFALTSRLQRTGQQDSSKDQQGLDWN